jgi:hypothetical protein
MKLGLLFFGMSKNEYHHWNKSKYVIDYENSYENYKKFIFDFFESKGYEIDVYFTTNILSKEDQTKICKIYNPIACEFIENEENFIKSRNNKLDHVIDLCIDSGIEYDLILITRFDLLFQKDFETSNIQFDLFNLVSTLERPYLICDNFYLFPYRYLKPFSGLVKNRLKSNFHYIKMDLYRMIGETSVNYILDESCLVADLSFYKIVRTPYVKPIVKTQANQVRFKFSFIKN